MKIGKGAKSSINLFHINSFILAFMTAAVTMTLLFFSLATGIAIAQEQVISTLRARTQQVKQWGGYILILVGIWFISLAMFVDFFASIFLHEI